MSGLKTSYEFTLPRGYIDSAGRLHRTGTMRLATARDELEPLRDPSVAGPDDPRLTILVLARVVERLGDLELVTSHDIEGLFAVDLAYLQDFYGVINFGSQEEYDELVRSQRETSLLGNEEAAAPDEAPAEQSAPAQGEAAGASPRPPLRTAVEELPRRAL
ncbi:MAG: hypothetical protein QOH14_1998 [Pseudonocardiales bacterium]|jgi:hypothetical protein|nr:hypothetical protein [Pseudonocardiales bacterium]